MKNVKKTMKRCSIRISELLDEVASAFSNEKRWAINSVSAYILFALSLAILFSYCDTMSNFECMGLIVIIVSEFLVGLTSFERAKESHSYAQHLLDCVEENFNE